MQAGNYNVEIVAKGFQRVLQENVQVNSLQKVPLNVKLSLGSDTTTITVSDQPAQLDTTNATLGGTIENELYTNLPLSMGGSPRDPTSFQYLMPGVQEGPPPTSSGGIQQGVYGGTGQTNLNENYIEGIPVTNVQSGGDNSPVAKAVSVDAVDQFSVQTNGASTAFGGAGVTNYTIKSGGNTLHGTVFDYIRNTAFDTWGYFAKVPSANGFAKKPAEHQNSYGGSLGGPILKDKLFFFVTYEGFSYTKLTNTPQYITIPTLTERTGDFTDQFGTTVPGLYDPINNRQPIQGLLNGIPTYNVIPAGEISVISTKLQSLLPTPTNLSTVNNYLAGLPLQNKDYTIDARLDYTLSARHKISITGVGGNRGFGNEPDYNNVVGLPVPYGAAIFTNSKTATGVVSYTFVASQTLINSLKYGFTRTWGETFNASSKGPLTAAKAGIGALPPGQASDTFPRSCSATARTRWARSRPRTGIPPAAMLANRAADRWAPTATPLSTIFSGSRGATTSPSACRFNGSRRTRLRLAGTAMCCSSGRPVTTPRVRRRREPHFLLDSTAPALLMDRRMRATCWVPSTREPSRRSRSQMSAAASVPMRFTFRMIGGSVPS